MYQKTKSTIRIFFALGLIAIAFILLSISTNLNSSPVVAQEPQGNHLPNLPVIDEETLARLGI